MNVALLIRLSSSLQRDTEDQSVAIQDFLGKLREVVSTPIVVVTPPLNRKES